MDRKRHYLPQTDHETIKTLVARHGLRPVVDSVAAAARQLMEKGIKVPNEYHEPMDVEDVELASYNLQEADLY